MQRERQNGEQQDMMEEATITEKAEKSTEEQRAARIFMQVVEQDFKDWKAYIERVERAYEEVSNHSTERVTSKEGFRDIKMKIIEGAVQLREYKKVAIMACNSMAAVRHVLAYADTEVVEQLRQLTVNYLNNCPRVGHERRRALPIEGMSRNLHTDEEEWKYDKLAEEDIEENNNEYAIAYREASPAMEQK